MMGAFKNLKDDHTEEGEGLLLVAREGRSDGLKLPRRGFRLASRKDFLPLSGRGVPGHLGIWGISCDVMTSSVIRHQLEGWSDFT